MARVIVNPGHREQRVHELRVGITTIGRGRESDLCVDHKSLSRQHARVVDGAGDSVLFDDRSKNGTFIDGERIVDPRRLVDGQRFTCSDLVFAYNVPERSILAPNTFVHEIPTGAQQAPAADLLSVAQERKLEGAPLSMPRDAAGRLQVLLDVARLLSSPESIENLLVKILDLVFSILDVDRVAIIMLDEDTGEFGVPVVESRRTERLAGDDQSYSKNILNYVRERSVAALFSDAARDPRLTQAESVHMSSVRSSMCAPLRAHDQVIGVLYVDNLTSPSVFDEADLELLSAFAAQAAVALQNSRLADRLQDEAVARSNLLRFFPPTAIAQLIKSPGLTDEPIETEVTALFCDISGFSEMSATMPPRDIVELLNHYFPIVTDIVFEHEGTLEKYIGDALLAVWGAPFRGTDDARQAVHAAVEMQIAIERLTTEMPMFPSLGIHIGINTGIVAAGNIGSKHYLQYATIGEATNLASRICNVAKTGEIALGVPTVERLGGRLDWPIEGPEFCAVKGREALLPVYKLRWRE